MQRNIEKEDILSVIKRGRRPLFQRSARYGIIYLTNQKCACTSLKLAMQRLEVDDYNYRPREVHKDSTLQRTDTIGWDRIIDHLNNDDFVFTFVRDPIARAISLYVEKLGNTRYVNAKMSIQRSLGLPEDPERLVTLDQFVDAIEIQNPEDMNPHWRPQFINTLYGVVELDFIGRLENFDADWKIVRTMAGLPNVPIDILNSTKSHQRDFLSNRPDLKTRIQQIYERDLEIFGY